MTPPMSPVANASKLITCSFTDDGRAQNLIKALKEEKGIFTANMYQCRGFGAMDKPGRLRRLPQPHSVRVLTVVVPEERADELFSYIWTTAEMDRPDGGLIYQTPLNGATLFTLPDEADEERREEIRRDSETERRGTERDGEAHRDGTDRRDVD